MDKEYLHSVDLNLLQKETGKTIDEISEIAGIAQSRNLGKWRQEKSKGGCRPTYDAIGKLIKLGATPRSLFGFDVKISVNEERITQQEIEDGVKNVLAEMLKSMNSKGTG